MPDNNENDDDRCIAFLAEIGQICYCLSDIGTTEDSILMEAR